MIDAQSLAVRTAVMVLVAVALITFYLRRAVGAPADALRSASGRLAGDDLETPVELGVVASDPETMRRRLAGRMEALERLRHLSAQSKAIWRKSTFSGLNGCVEIALLDGQIAVRDSKDRNGPILLFTRAEWDAFLSGVKQGQFG
jgi:hypothetical protein